MTTLADLATNDLDPNGHQNLNPSSIEITSPTDPLGTIIVNAGGGVIMYVVCAPFTEPVLDFFFTYTIRDQAGVVSLNEANVHVQIKIL